MKMGDSGVMREPAGAARFAVAADDIRSLCRPALDAGISLVDILRSVDLPANLLDESRAESISLADYFRILERLSVAVHDETCGLSTRRLLPGATGLVLSNLSSCKNLYEAMKAVANAYNLLHGGSYNRVERRDDCLAYIIDDSTFPYSIPADSEQVCFTMECVLIFLHGMLSLISSANVHELLRKVHTKRAQPVGQRGYMDFWPVSIGWKARHFALCYDLAAAEIPIRHDGGTPSLQSIYRGVIELIEHDQASAPRARSLMARITEAFDENVYGQEAVAKRLGLSVATMRRKLKEEGQPGFRVLRERALNEAAKALLAQRRHPSEVAEELGFGDLRSFARAFKRLNGTTPAAFAHGIAKATDKVDPETV